MRNGKKGIDSPPSTKKSEEAVISPEDASGDTQEVLDTEGTPKENRRRFLGIMARVQEKLGTEVQHEGPNEYLENRSEELNAEAEKMGGLEKLFRSWGEKYNQYGWKTKLAVGLGLGIGAGVLSTFSFVGVAACLSGIAAQRVAGMSSMFLKYEKSTSEEKWLGLGKKEKAMGKAMLYTAGMTAGMLLLVEGVKEGVEYANQHQWGERTREWLGHMLGHDSATTEMQAPAQPQADIPAHIVAPSVHEVPPTPEMPSVEASTGHGYEYMAKRLWEQLQEKDLDPNQYAEGSDIRRLLEADASSIDKVVHQIAADPEHGFYNADGTSVRITLDSHMTINADGDLQLDGAVKAPEDAPVTPSYPPAGDAQADVIPQEASQPPRADVSSETQAPPIIEKSFISNKFGLVIPVAEPHIYIDPGAKHLFVYGGSPLERANAIQEYLAEKPDAVVFSADDSGKYRIPWHLVGGKATPEAPVQTHGFLGFFKSFMKAPEPNEFEKSIK